MMKKSILFCETRVKFTDFRTDLALELRENLEEKNISGIKTEFDGETIWQMF